MPRSTIQIFRDLVEEAAYTPGLLSYDLQARLQRCRDEGKPIPEMWQPGRVIMRQKSYDRLMLQRLKASDVQKEFQRWILGEVVPQRRKRFVKLGSL